MPVREFSVEREGPKRLRLDWRGNWRQLTVTLDDETLGEIDNPDALKHGINYPLPDNSQLTIRLVQRLYSSRLEVLRDGRPLPGSDSDPHELLRNAATMVFFIAGLNLLLGLAELIFHSSFLQSMGVGWFSILFGLVYTGLGLLVRRRVAAALWVAVLLFAADGILGFVLTATAGQGPSIASLLARVLLLIPMVQGLGAIAAIKREPADH